MGKNALYSDHEGIPGRSQPLHGLIPLVKDRRSDLGMCGGAYVQVETAFAKKRVDMCMGAREHHEAMW